MVLITRWMRKRAAKRLYERFEMGARHTALMLAKALGFNALGRKRERIFCRQMERILRLRKGQPAWEAKR